MPARIASFSEADAAVRVRPRRTAEGGMAIRDSAISDCPKNDSPLHLQRIYSSAPLQVVTLPIAASQTARAPASAAYPPPRRPYEPHSPSRRPTRRRSAWIMRRQLGNSMDVQFATANTGRGSGPTPSSPYPGAQGRVRERLKSLRVVIFTRRFPRGRARSAPGVRRRDN
jgi:hypothetical protein